MVNVYTVQPVVADQWIEVCPANPRRQCVYILYDWNTIEVSLGYTPAQCCNIMYTGLAFAPTTVVPSPGVDIPWDGQAWIFMNRTLHGEFVDGPWYYRWSGAGAIYCNEIQYAEWVLDPDMPRTRQVLEVERKVITPSPRCLHRYLDTIARYERCV